MKSFTAGKNDAGQRLDRFAAKAAPMLPPSLLQKYIRLKRIKVGGRGSKRDYRLMFGDIIEMYINDEFFEAPNERNAFLKITEPGLDIIFEDENLLLVNKKAGVLCHSAEKPDRHGSYDYATLIARIQAHLYMAGQWKPREENSFAPALCNRIDRNTSGIVIAAKNAETLRIINEKIKLREIDKYYLAAVHGTVTPQSGRLEGFLFKDSVKNRVFVSERSVPGAKTAVTEYRTLARAGNLTLLECRLITGRTHQIRAQLAHAGYPLLGDGKYGGEFLNKPYGEKHQALCSYKTVFAFKTDAGLLNYLCGMTFMTSRADFVEKYFSSVYNTIDI